MSVISISAGSSAGAMLSYLEHGRGRHDPNRESRIAAWDSSTRARSLEEVEMDWDLTREAWGKTGGREYTHVSLSLDPKDPRAAGMADERLLGMGRELAEAIAPGHDSVEVVHRDRDHLHVHVVLNSVNHETGRKLHVSRADLERALVAKDVLDWKYDLQRTERTPVRDRYARVVIQRLDRDPNGYLWTQDLKERIGVAAARADSWEDYVARLAEERVSVSENRDRIRLTYAMRDANGEERKASERKLGTDYWRATIERDIERRNSAPERQPDGTAIDREEDLCEREQLGREVTSRLRLAHAEHDRERSRSDAKPPEKPRQEPSPQEPEPEPAPHPRALPVELRTRERKRTKDALEDVPAGGHDRTTGSPESTVSRLAELDRAIATARAEWEREFEAASAVRDSRLAAGKDTTPRIPPAELGLLQDQAISRNDARAFDELEVIRQAQRTEPHLPARSADDLARLEARAVVARSDADRAGLETPTAAVDRANEMAAALERAIAVEKQCLEPHRWAVPEPKFTGVELHRLEENALVTRDVELLDRVDRSLWRDPSLSLEAIVSRSLGRAVVAGLEQQVLGRNHERPGASSNPMIDRETRQMVLFAVDEHAHQFEAERAAVAAYADRTSGLANGYVERLAAQGIDVPKPSFSSFERERVERWLAVEKTAVRDSPGRQRAFDLVLDAVADNRIDPFLGGSQNAREAHGERPLRALGEEDRGAARGRGDGAAARHDRPAQGGAGAARSGEHEIAVGPGRDDSSLRPVGDRALGAGEARLRGGEGGDRRVERLEERMSFLSDRVEVLAVLAQGLTRTGPTLERRSLEPEKARALGHDQPLRVAQSPEPSRHVPMQPDRCAGPTFRPPESRQPERSLDRSGRDR